LIFVRRSVNMYSEVLATLHDLSIFTPSTVPIAAQMMDLSLAQHDRLALGAL